MSGDEFQFKFADFYSKTDNQSKYSPSCIDNKFQYKCKKCKDFLDPPVPHEKENKNHKFISNEKL